MDGTRKGGGDHPSRKLFPPDANSRLSGDITPTLGIYQFECRSELQSVSGRMEYEVGVKHYWMVTALRHRNEMAGIYLVTADRVRAIVDVKVIVAVQLKVVETEHEPLKDAVCLEGDGAVEVLLELRLQNRPVYLPVQISHVILLAHVAYVICERERFIIRIRSTISISNVWKIEYFNIFPPEIKFICTPSIDLPMEEPDRSYHV